MPFLLLMPSYNQARYIVEAVESCLAQNDPDWQLWILDNSTDDTPQAMRAFDDPRVRFLHEPERIDPGSCLNRLLGMARGEHFSYVHTDNRLLPDYVRRFRAALRGHELALAYCDFIQIDAEAQSRKLRKRPPVFPSERLFSTHSLGVPFAATTALAARVGGFSADDLADDVFFVMKADGLGPRIHVPHALVEYRVHGDSRAEQQGANDVLRSTYRSALKAYGQRSPALDDPFRDMQGKIARHVDLASRTARVLARALLSRMAHDASVWIEGTGPASFWLAWACAAEGRSPFGFLSAEPRPERPRLLGLPVLGGEEPLPAGHVALRPLKRSPHRAGSVGPDRLQKLRWALRGLPPQGRALKRYPGAILSSLLIPLHHRAPSDGEPLWIRGRGPAAAYLAYGAESLAGLEVAGWIGDEAPFAPGLPTLPDPPAGACVWKVPGEPGSGEAWGVSPPRG